MRWTDAEVLRLKQGYREFGRQWAKIRDKFGLEGRTSVNIKDKFRNLVKNGEIRE